MNFKEYLKETFPEHKIEFRKDNDYEYHIYINNKDTHIDYVIYHRMYMPTIDPLNIKNMQTKLNKKTYKRIKDYICTTTNAKNVGM